jgi:ABC-2 type transport system permease protein
MTRLRALTSSFRHQMLHFFAEPQWLIPNIVAPFVMTLVALMLFRNSSGNFILYAILGGGMMGMWGNTLYSSGYSIQFDRWNGTLEAVLATPAPLVWIIAGRSLWNALIGILNAVFIFVIAVFWFQVPLTLVDPPLFFLSLFLTLMSLAALGLVFSSAFVLTRNASVLTNGLEFPIYVGTGTMFPIAMLPALTGPLSLSLAPSWGIDAMRYSALSDYEGLSLGYWGDMGMMVVLALVYVFVAFFLFQLVERRVRVKGDIGRI